MASSMGMKEEPLRKESFKWFPEKAHELLRIRIIVFDAHSACMIKVSVYTAVAIQHMFYRQVRWTPKIGPEAKR